MDNGGYNGQGGAPIGAVLEKARRERGLSLRDVEDATKIRTRYLEGLEREDFSVLPDAVYVQGFLKTYANFLGLNGDEMARDLRNRRSPRRDRQQPSYEPPQSSEFERPLMSPGGLAGAERRRVSGAAVLTVALALLVIAGVIGALYYVGVQSSGTGTPEDQQQAQPERAENPAPQEEQPAPEQNAPEQRREPAGEPAGEQPAREPAATPSREQAPEESAAETVSVTLTVADSPAGLTVSVDGTVAADVLAQPGFSQTFEGEEVVTVSTANAGAVEATVDGEDLGRLGYFGQPLTRDFTPQP
jgi:cytoskeletal protein RodZ